MKILSLSSYNYRSNTYLAISQNRCAIIDPGLESKSIEDAISKSGVIPDFILLTHGHFDHIFSLDKIRDKYKIPVYIHEDDAEMLTDSMKNAYSVFFGGSFVQKAADKTFKDGDKIYIGNEALTVLHTPGHSKGSSLFFCSDILITGDTLFANGIGRADLHGGNSSVLYSSLHKLKKLASISDKISIFPGHGESAYLKNAINNVIY